MERSITISRVRLLVVGIAVLVTGILAGGSLILRLQPTPERFVQVNAFGEWRGFEISGENVRWVMSCGVDKPHQWKSRSERIGDSLKDFTRQSQLVFDHPSLGAFAKVDNFSKAQIDMATANMRIILKQWSAEQTPGDKITGCGASA